MKKKCENIYIQWFADILNSISQVNRLQIICLLSAKWELCVCDIMDSIQLKQNLVSHHLHVLKTIWLLITRREGKKIYYSLDKEVYKKLKGDFKVIFNI
jgi:ArsR family transcriptional regulator